jgi:predicted nucleic acid-binding protein
MIVFDSSTMILLARIDVLDLFISNFPGRAVIPEKVRVKVCIKGREETPLIEYFIAEQKISVLKAKNRENINKVMEDFNIDEGEAEALILAIQEGAKAIATDDRNAIRACKLLKLNFITAIVFLIRSFEKNLISRDEALIKLKKLHSIGRYSNAIIEDATIKIKGSNEKWTPRP